MKPHKYIFLLIILIISLLLIVFIGRHVYKVLTLTSAFPANTPSERQIESYGRDKFVSQTLEFKTTGTLNSELLRKFKPIRVEYFRDGVLLIFAENKRYEKGLYVHPEEFFEDMAGSGVSVIRRSNHVGDAEFKKRVISPNLKGVEMAGDDPNKN